MAPSSAYANAPKNEMMPVIIQMARIMEGDGSSRAIEPGTMKMPTPIVVPMTMEMASNRFNWRDSSGIVGTIYHSIVSAHACRPEEEQSCPQRQQPVAKSGRLNGLTPQALQGIAKYEGSTAPVFGMVSSDRR